MKFVVDIFGADNSPHELVLGCVLALQKDSEISLILSGDREIIEQELQKHQVDRTRIEILHAPEVITNDDVPTEAVVQKQNSSLMAGLTRTANDDSVKGMISAGSTGACLIGSFVNLGRIAGIIRPALAPILPTATGGRVLLIDCGANVDCKPQYLEQFALMGCAFAKKMFNVDNPRVALLSNGTEDKKGNDLIKNTFPLLKELPINFVGNIEARDVLSGDYEVVVSDGFNGNICLKAIEGTAKMIGQMLKKALYANAKSKVGALLLKKQLTQMKQDMDYTEYGGACLLGVNKVFCKAHGSTKAKEICASIFQAKNAYQTQVIEDIKQYLNKINEN